MAQPTLPTKQGSRNASVQLSSRQATGCVVLFLLPFAAAAAPDVATSTRDVYLIFLERFRDNVAAAVRAVARAPEGGVVIHCVGGKDRTGLLAAFLLHLAGVDDETIAADYALSEERLLPRHDVLPDSDQCEEAAKQVFEA